MTLHARVGVGGVNSVVTNCAVGSIASSGSLAPGGGGNRKSNVVKEIERIQQRREERRAAQRAIRDQPEFDPSNPNYEFLMMIRFAFQSYNSSSN
ncbi:unnamed protein product [Protopolystoma xenopodis]|uniref:Uncharacterized protein n=1 Tax=Protopolystoma xenopodis TaxID=117903 RepID=A0A448X8G9_9PLAT|nr:unnamed protein product [Protopolystoma xenopodis]